MAFQKGQSGNPGGRSTMKPWTDALRRALARNGGDVNRGLDKLADAVYALAADGDKDAWREFGDRLEGKPMQNVTVTKDARTATDAELTAIIDEGDSGEGIVAPSPDSQLTH